MINFFFVFDIFKIIERDIRTKIYKTYKTEEGVSMKRLVIVMLILMLTSGVTFAAGGKNHGSKGQGATGSTGKGSVTQTRGK